MPSAFLILFPIPPFTHTPLILSILSFNLILPYTDHPSLSPGHPSYHVIYPHLNGSPHPFIHLSPLWPSISQEGRLRRLPGPLQKMGAATHLLSCLNLDRHIPHSQWELRPVSQSKVSELYLPPKRPGVLGHRGGQSPGCLEQERTLSQRPSSYRSPHWV